MSRSHAYRPMARSEGLLEETLGHETLVYDLRTHRAHCLNPAARHVWRLADGSRTVAEIAGKLPEVDLPSEVDVVSLALDELFAAGLLAGAPAPARAPGVGRREVLRALGLAAGATLLLPAIDSVTAPLAAQASSCLTNGQCRGQPTSNCTGLPICNDRTRCCTLVSTRRGSQCRPRPC